ncbi:uncharacterized protein LOC136029132 [Artemia franciscana]|uniref:uncharacterized protein LOC136029132 n=1 Tax=Artemia franciscana TaxID=6661 RepID=UPI0032DA88F0
MNKMEFCNHLYDKVMKFVKLDNANEVMNELETMAKNDVTMKIRVGAVKIYLQKKNKEVLEGHLKMSKIYAQINHDSESWRMFLQKEDAVRSAHNVYSSINDSEESLKLNEEEWLRRGFAEYRSKVLKKLNIRSMIQQREHKAEWMIDLLKHPELLQQNNEEENLKIKEKLFLSANRYNNLEKAKRFLRKHFDIIL